MPVVRPPAEATAATRGTAPGREFGLFVEDRRVAGMGDELGDVRSLGPFARMGRRGVEDDERGAGSSLSTI
jgi:hypothetical protein